MIRSREIALRCAASLRRNLLAHRQPNERRQSFQISSGLSYCTIHKKPLTLFDQLDACKSEEARRLLLGVSR